MSNAVKFRSESGKVFDAEVVGDLLGNTVAIQIKGDPFPVVVNRDQLEGNVAKKDTKEKVKTARELRQEAKGLGIKGYSDMSRAELKAAVDNAQAAGSGTAPRRKKKTKASKATTKKAPAKAARKKSAKPKKAESKKATTKKSTKKATAKKASAKKAVAKRAESKKDDKKKVVRHGHRHKVQKGRVKKLPMQKRAGRMSQEEKEAYSEKDNPFRPGTNIYFITEALLKGGKRSTLVKRLRDKMEFNPYVQDEKELDRDKEIDRRLRVFGYLLKNDHGYTYVLRGRGPDAYVKVYPPSAEIDPEDEPYAQTA